MLMCDAHCPCFSQVYVKLIFNLYIFKTRENPENRYTMYLTCEQRNKMGTTIKLFDEILVFDDYIKCKEVRTILQTHVSKVRDLKKQQLMQLLSQPCEQNVTNGTTPQNASTNTTSTTTSTISTPKSNKQRSTFD